MPGFFTGAEKPCGEALGRHDLVIVAGAAAFLLYIYDPGELVRPETKVAVITEFAEEANRSDVQLALVAPPGLVCARLAGRLAQRDGRDPPRRDFPTDPAPPAADGPLLPGHVFVALRECLPRNVVLMEETPSSRAELMRRIPTRAPLGYLSSANGALGFGLSAATGLAMALDDRPVVAVLGDGSCLYAIQALWSAANYGAPLLAIVMANRRYAVMDDLPRKPADPAPGRVSVRLISPHWQPASAVLFAGSPTTTI